MGQVQPVLSNSDTYPLAGPRHGPETRHKFHSAHRLYEVLGVLPLQQGQTSLSFPPQIYHGGKFHPL